MERLRASILAAHSLRLERSTARLQALSPLAVLSRGYALVYTEEGALLRQAEATQPGQQIRARLANGSLIATVKETTA